MIESFPAIIPHAPKILILGTMPGVMSLQKQQYYGFPQNAFWKILFMHFKNTSVPADYTARIEILHENDIALWDVLAYCERKGSLDVHIKNQVENDIPTLLKTHSTIKKILFNGKESRKFFVKSFGELTDFPHEVMPSTSPANTMKFAEKLRIWSDAITS